MTGLLGGGYKYESPEARALGSITQDSYDYRDQGKLLSKLTSDVSYMAGMQRKMQKGIDDANENFIQQIQSLIGDVITLFGGGGDTGLDFGDLKYLLQAFGAMFGFFDEDGNLQLPINLFSAAWHFFSNFIGISGNFTELINQIIDAMISTVLDLFGDIPIVGQALQQLAQIISEIRDILLPISDALQEVFDAFNLNIGDSSGIGGFFGPLAPIVDAFMSALDGIELPDFAAMFHVVAQWLVPFVNLIAEVIAAFAPLITTLIDMGSGIFNTIAELIAPVISVLAPILELINPVITALSPILDIITGIISMFGIGDSPSGFDPIAAITHLISNFINPVGLITSILDPNAPLNAANLFGLGNLLGIIGIGNLSSDQPEMLDSPDFREAITLQGGGIWTYDSVEGRTVAGCASIVANGSVRQLMSNSIAVSEGDTVDASIWAKWSGLTYTGTQPIKLQIVRLLYSSVTRTFATMGTDTIAGPTSPGATQATWSQLLPGASYTVPANTSHIALQLIVNNNATAGTVKFDDGSVKKSGEIQQHWVKNLVGDLGGISDLIDNVINTVVGALGNIPFVGGMIEELFHALSNIPSINVGGVAGPPDIGGSILSFIDNLVSGFVGIIGGSGAGLSDVFNTGQDISSRATQGQMSFDILGIRNNRGFNTGFLPTTQSTIGLDALALQGSAPTIAVTQSTAITGYQRIAQAEDRTVVSWQGYGATNVTNCFINIYKMDLTTGVNTLVHASTNQVSLLPVATPPQPIVYSLPTAVHVEPGEVYGIEIAIRGTGTHNVLGSTSWLADQGVYPRRYSSVRNSGTSAPPSTFTPTYGTNVPFIEFGVSAGVIDIPHSPLTLLFNAAGSFSQATPSWANFIEVIEVGAGGGGFVGSGPPTSGEGGGAGVWNTTTWQRGAHWDTATNPTITGTVGAGGVGSGTPSDSGANGGTTSATLPATTGHSASTLTATGGAGGNEWVLTDADNQGKSPGNQVYGGISYSGGLAQDTNSGNGNSPGGGGAGGDTSWISVHSGGKGGNGAVWLRFRQY